MYSSPSCTGSAEMLVCGLFASGSLHITVASLCSRRVDSAFIPLLLSPTGLTQAASLPSQDPLHGGSSLAPLYAGKDQHQGQALREL